MVEKTMMNLQETTPPNHPADELLNEYLDGCLPVSETSKLETHLAACSACTARLDRLQRVFASLAGLPDVELSNDLSPDVLAALRPQPRSLGLLKWAALAELITVCVLFVILSPYLDDWWQRLSFTPAALVTFSRDWAAQFALGLTSLQIDWSQWLAGWRLPALSQAHQIPVWPVLLSATALFMIGNAILLRHVSRNGAC